MTEERLIDESTDEEFAEALTIAQFDRLIDSIGANETDYIPSESLKRKVLAAYSADEKSRFYCMFMGFYAGFCMGFETLANMDNAIQEQPNE